MVDESLNDNNQGGFVLLTAVIVTMAMGVVIAVSVQLLSVASSRTSLVIEQSAKARYLADACAEYAMGRLRLDDTYAGNESISIGSDSCFVETPGGSGESNRTVATYATVSDVTRRVRVTGIDFSSTPVITRWEELESY